VCGATFERVWRGYAALQQQPPFRNQRLLTASYSLNAPLLAALLRLVAATARESAAAAAAAVAAGATPAQARARCAMVGLEPRTLRGLAETYAGRAAANAAAAAAAEAAEAEAAAEEEAAAAEEAEGGYGDGSCSTGESSSAGRVWEGVGQEDEEEEDDDDDDDDDDDEAGEESAPAKWDGLRRGRDPDGYMKGMAVAHTRRPSRPPGRRPGRGAEQRLATCG
jgi:hypothetical protein